MEDDPYFDKKPPDDEGGDKTVQAILASVRDDKDTGVDTPDGMKIDPKRTSFVEVGALKNQRSSMAVSLVSSTVSSQHLKPDMEEDDEVTIGDNASTPGSKHSSSLIYVSFVFSLVNIFLL